MSEESNFPKISGITIIKEKYKTKRSTIYLCRNESLNKITILKAIAKKSLSEKSFEMLQREREFYSSKLEQNLFPSFINSYKDSLNLYIEMSFIEGINFSKLLTEEKILSFNNRAKTNINLYLNLISQIIHIMKILHMNNYCYRDLKLNNLIIDKNLNLSLIDFGFVKKLDNSNCTTSTICGTFHMKAPELFLAMDGKLKEYNPFAYDIYSIGVIMYEIYYGKAPFGYFIDNSEIESFKQKIYKGINDEFFDKDIDIELKELIIKCMSVEPKNRPNIEEIIKDKLWEKYGGFEKIRGLNKDFVIIKNDKQIKDFIEYIEFSGDFLEDYECSEDKKKMDDLFNDF